jgi:hypothetical protein
MEEILRLLQIFLLSKPSVRKMGRCSPTANLYGFLALTKNMEDTRNIMAPDEQSMYSFEFVTDLETSDAKLWVLDCKLKTQNKEHLFLHNNIDVGDRQSLTPRHAILFP